MNLKVCHKEICLQILKAHTTDEVDARLGHGVGLYLMMQRGRNSSLEAEVNVLKICAVKRKAQLKNKLSSKA